jgi:hypothetical protein
MAEQEDRGNQLNIGHRLDREQVPVEHLLQVIPTREFGRGFAIANLKGF